MTEQVAELAALIDDARHGVALTGAGVSTDSGIPDFRSDGGLWGDADPAKVASIEGFHGDPVGFYAFWADKFSALTSAQPNATHRLLSELEARSRIQAVVTQNIDGLHSKAGSRRVFEVHGSFRAVSCLSCSYRGKIETLFDQVGRGEAPSCPTCGGPKVKPDVVLFGEALPSTFAEAEREVEVADLLLVLGSSLAVYPVAELVPKARRAGAKVALINREPGPFDDVADLVIHADLKPTVKLLTRHLGL